MYDERRVLFFKTLTALHAGTGTDLRAVDLPIQREVHTGFPKVEASTLKGCLRNAFGKGDEENNKILSIIFGKADKSSESGRKDNELFAAAIAITDTRLLFFPVRSAKGIYALITCPLVLKRFFDDLDLVNLKKKFNILSLENLLSDKPAIANQSDKDEHILVFNINEENRNNKKSILLDEYRFDVEENQDFTNFCNILDEIFGIQGSISAITKRAVLLPDDYFKDFVMNATSIVTRIQIGDEGVAENQALFTEEYLPEECILYSLIMMSESKDESEQRDAKGLMQFFKEKMPEIFQIGANETLGKGFVKTYLMDGDGNDR